MGAEEDEAEAEAEFEARVVRVEAGDEEAFEGC